MTAAAARVRWRSPFRTVSEIWTLLQSPWPSGVLVKVAAVTLSQSVYSLLSLLVIRYS